MNGGADWGVSMRGMTVRGLAAAVVAMTALGSAGCQRATTAANAVPVAAAASAAPAALDPASAAEAQAFLTALYAHYKTSKNNDFNMFDAKSGVFDTDTLRLLDDDAKALKGDLGVIDGDWLCACQDFVSLRAKITILAATPTTAKATSEFVDVGMTDPKDRAPRHDSFDLVKEAGHWRIHDLTAAGDDQSLRQQLTKEIADLRAHPGTNDAG